MSLFVGVEFVVSVVVVFFVSLPNATPTPKSATPPTISLIWSAKKCGSDSLSDAWVLVSSGDTVASAFGASSTAGASLFCAPSSGTFFSVAASALWSDCGLSRLEFFWALTVDLTWWVCFSSCPVNGTEWDGAWETTGVSWWFNAGVFFSGVGSSEPWKNFSMSMWYLDAT